LNSGCLQVPVAVEDSSIPVSTIHMPDSWPDLDALVFAIRLDIVARRDLAVRRLAQLMQEGVLRNGSESNSDYSQIAMALTRACGRAIASVG